MQSTLHKEMLTRSQQQNSLQGDVTKMAREQNQYAKQIIDFQGELYERTQQLATTLETMNTMARKMNGIKRKVTRWEREGQSAFPDQVCQKIMSIMQEQRLPDLGMLVHYLIGMNQQLQREPLLLPRLVHIIRVLVIF